MQETSTKPADTTWPQHAVRIDPIRVVRFSVTEITTARARGNLIGHLTVKFDAWPALVSCQLFVVPRGAWVYPPAGRDVNGAKVMLDDSRIQDALLTDLSRYFGRELPRKKRRGENVSDRVRQESERFAQYCASMTPDERRRAFGIPDAAGT